MRTSTSPNLFTSLAILLSTLTLAHAIPSPELLTSTGKPPHTLLPPGATFNGTDVNGTDTNPASTPRMALAGTFEASCSFIDPFGNGEPANVAAITEGIDYLRTLSGAPVITQWSCRQVTCIQESAIFVCNEEMDISLQFRNYGDIATGAQAVLHWCGTREGTARGKAMTGEEGLQWSVIVTGEKC
ncbi:hypothetical protein SMACR_09341 [Sordaria macrospora]|uniref:Ecp2 effector protein domain-containing protein n=1 Tax=Sordaria macrospora TaxID=5147 RepID=A0A8S8ZFQ2_SORMA|nr:hypothetical protein SMACR_09341 [Sordaria macrospora]KAH7625155.1 hypothetical protein B0T09DRAFT_361557 [Sordaria sp. MPI-SDFR-AT-0083]